MLPKLPNADKIKKAQTIQFSGINRNPAAVDGTLWDTHNMSADRMPCLSPRKPRYQFGQYDDCHGIYAYNGLYMVRGTTLYKDGTAIGELPTESDKQIVSMNGKLIVYPDKSIVDQDSVSETTTWKNGLYLSDVKANFLKDPDMNYSVLELPDLNMRELGIEGGDEITISGSSYETNNKTATINRCGTHKAEFRQGVFRIALDETITIYKAGVDPLTIVNVKVDVASGYNSTMGMDQTLFYAYGTVDFREMGLEAGDTVTISGSSIPGNNKTATLLAVNSRFLAFPFGTFATVAEDVITITKVPQEDVSGAVSQMEVELDNITVVFEDGTLYGEPADRNTIKRTTGLWTNTGLRVGDAVTIKGSSETVNNGTFVIREIDGTKLRFYENSFENTTQDGVSPEETETITIGRYVPDLDGIFTNENRIWGFKGNTIYASKLGDPLNFSVFDGLEDDSWTWEMDGSGDIIGGIVYQGYPTFFKEDKVVRIYGDRPSQFRAMDVSTMGIMQDCGKSLAIAGDTLYYVSRNGVTSFNGGYGQNAHIPFGDLVFTRAYAVSDGRRYYLSAYDGSSWNIWVYDTVMGCWMREDSEHIVSAAWDRGNLYFLFEKIQGQRYLWLDGHAVRIPDYATKENFYSGVTFNDFTGNYWTARRGYGNPSRKGTGKIQIRVTLDNAALTAWIAFDDGEKIKVGEMHTEGKRSYYLPIIPRRSDHYRIILEGAGDWTLNSLVREEYSGSDIH